MGSTAGHDLTPSRLGLGTVQFGLDYGFTKKKSQAEVDAILEKCIEKGVHFLDTARDYGDSEAKIGHFLKNHPAHPFTVATKVSPIPPETLRDRQKIKDHFRQSLEKSATALGLARLPLVQMHQGHDSELINNDLWDVVREMREKQQFEQFGISVYEPEPVKDIIFRYAGQIDFIQIPFNLLDERFFAVKNLLAEKNIKVISRSAFLRGILVSKNNEMPAETAKARDGLAQEAAGLNLKLEEYALLYALSQDWIVSTIAGVDSAHELEVDANLLAKSKNFSRPKPKVGPVKVINQDLIDPRKWGGIELLAILQARMSSSRLPGKVLMPVLGEPMLWRQIERVRRSQKISKLIIATSTDPSDDPIEAFCAARGVDCFRGDLNRVLDRFYQAAVQYRPKNILRLTGDCPLSDPAVIDELVDFFNAGNYDYASNTIPHTYPDGLDAEIFTAKALAEAWRLAAVPYAWEHVTPYIYGNPQIFKLGSFAGKQDLSALRWTVDTKEDFERIRHIYEALYPENPFFGLQDILRFLTAESRR